MSRIIQVFEHDKLTANSRCKNGKELGDKIIDKLWQYNDSHKNIYFEAIRHGVKFKSYVGVIQIGTTTIEILPKADKQNINSNEEKEIWHDILLKMLAQCKKIKVSAVSEASLRKRYHSLLDLYFELFVHEVTTLMQQGLIKKYNSIESNVSALKGRLLFSKNIQQNIIRKDRFYTQHQEYNHNHIANQILINALKILKSISQNASLQDAINRLLLNFPEIKEIDIQNTHFDQLVFNRKTLPYEEAIKIAKMIILNYSPDIKGGDENMLALLFDMNKLWEEYVFRKLQKIESSNLKVSFQNRDKFWEHKVIKPDIVISKTYQIDSEIFTQNFVIDTKWKIKEVSDPDDDDLKQMYVYNMYWQAEKSMLLYPTTKPIISNFGKFHKGRDKGNFCKLGFVKVMNGTGLNDQLGVDIINLLE